MKFHAFGTLNKNQSKIKKAKNNKTHIENNKRKQRNQVGRFLCVIILVCGEND
jgi:hypothetical protein